MQSLPSMRRTVDNIKDPLFRFFEREVNAGARLLSDVRRDIQETMLICQGEKKPTNYHRNLMNELAKGGKELDLHWNCLECEYFNPLSLMKEQ